MSEKDPYEILEESAKNVSKWFHSKEQKERRAECMNNALKHDYREGDTRIKPLEPVERCAERAFIGNEITAEEDRPKYETFKDGEWVDND